MSGNRLALTVLRPVYTSALRRVVVPPFSASNLLHTSRSVIHGRILSAWQFSTSAYQHAKEGNPGVKNDPDIVETVDKSPMSAVFSEHPQLLASVHRFIEIAKEEGIDLTSPNPSFSTMMKMVGNQRVKDAATALREEFRSAGLEMSKEDALSFLNGLKDKKE